MANDTLRDGSTIAKPGRIIWQDTAKGLAIMLVVLGHVERGLLNSGIVSARAWSVLDFAVYTFHMPLFMFLAGLNVPHSLQAGRPRFLRSKVLGVLYPYFLWILLQGLVLEKVGHLTNNGSRGLSLASFVWAPISPFWFLNALFVFSVAAAFLPARMLLTISGVTFLLGELLPPDRLPHQLLHFLLFFAAGMVCSAAMRDVRLSAAQGLLGATAATTAITLAERSGFHNFNSVLMLPAAIGASACLIWIAQEWENFPLLAWLGRISLAIYVMHILAAAGARILMQKFLHIPANAWLYLTSGMAIGVFVPALIYLSLERARLLPIFGLGIGPRGRHWIDGGQTTSVPPRREGPSAG